jgi:hypothetical protein
MFEHVVDADAHAIVDPIRWAEEIMIVIDDRWPMAQ